MRLGFVVFGEMRPMGYWPGSFNGMRLLNNVCLSPIEAFGDLVVSGGLNLDSGLTPAGMTPFPTLARGSIGYVPSILGNP